MAPLASLAALIARSHQEPGNAQIQSSVLQQCLDAVAAADGHVFCNQELKSISEHALVMLSFHNFTQQFPQGAAVADRFAASLACPDCVCGFAASVCNIRKLFLVRRNIDVRLVNQFIDIVAQWQLPRVLRRLASLESNDTETNLALLVECLWCPWLLRLAEKARTGALRLLLGISDVLVLLPHLYPAFVLYLVEGNDTERAIAQRYVSGLSDCSVLLPLADEYNHHLYRVQNAAYFTQPFSTLFWAMTWAVARAASAEGLDSITQNDELEQMSKHTNVRLFPLPRVLVNNIMAGMPGPMPSLLKTLQLLLERSAGFWGSTGALAVQVLDAVLGNPVVLEQKLFAWIPTFLSSVLGSQEQQACVRLSEFLVKNPTDMSPASVLVKVLNRLALSQLKGPAGVLKVHDSRVAVSNNAGHYVSSVCAKSQHWEDALEVILAGVEYDVTLSRNNSALLATGKMAALADNDQRLWLHLSKLPLFDPEVTMQLLISLTGASQIIRFKDTKTERFDKDVCAAVKIHNRGVDALAASICIVLDKVAMAEPEALKKKLFDARALVALWDCLFCPSINQLTLDIVYCAFDAEGRLEAISAMLRQSVPLALSALNTSLAKITHLKVFEPCPKALRIMMDVTKGLTDPLNGALYTLTPGTDSEPIVRFWCSSWEFLIMIYDTTLTWASMYRLEDLIEFTRDTLDLSHLLIDSFRPISDYIGDPKRNVALMEVFMNAFNYVIVWLRLGDVLLLNSCVDLVFKGFGLAKELEVSVDSKFLESFAKYGAKAKKFNNKLTDEQRQDILAKASEFDAALVQLIVEEASRHLDTKRDIRSASLTPPPVKGATYTYETQAKKPRQSTLTRFGIVTKEAPVAPPPPKPFKANNMEAIRNELKVSRSKPIGTPAPPRPAGFNSKRVAVGRSLNTLKPRRDSDSSGDDGEVDMSDLFLDTKKKAKIQEVDLNGNVIRTAQSKPKNDRKEEERRRMRLHVNLKPLYSTILRWSYNTDSEFPTEARDVYFPKKDTYRDAKEYVKLMEPLLMLECWQGIQSSRTTGQELPFELLVGSRTTCDGFFDVYCSIKKADLTARKIGESDLLVLGFVADKQLSSPYEVALFLKLSLASTCLAKVREVKYANPEFCDLTVRVYPLGYMVGILTPKSVIVGMKVMQMTTAEREFSSLKGLEYYDLCNEIILAKPARPYALPEKEAKKMCATYNVNMSQARAIAGLSLADGFSLIQGPPGTGKTKTILGIVGHFLSSARKPNVIAVPAARSAGVPSAPSPTESAVAKVLICAPSNAAVDELVVRLKDGVLDSHGNATVPKIVRLGRSDAVNAAVRELSLEKQVENQLKVREHEVAVDPKIREERDKCLNERNALRRQIDEALADTVVELEAKLREVNKRRYELSKRLDEQREQASIAHRTREIERRQAQAKILKEAQVICATLSGSAHDFLASMGITFDQVIIDEACQCVELSAIIPLRYGCKKCTMVGDPNQLPPTVLSQKAASYKYEESLFVRMQRSNPDSVYLLDVQYRMHPEISRFPSAQFYQSKLKDGEGMLAKNDRPWHSSPPMSPYRFFDIVSRHEQNTLTKSFFNTAEAKVALELVEKLMRILPQDKFKGRIGIISPYKEQIQKLVRTFRSKFGSGIMDEIDFNTVDGFQGQEKEIIIMSCVRASDTGSVGFLSDVRRMNVALTRARTTLWILGNKNSLRRDKVWSRLILDAEQRNCMTLARPGFLEQALANGGDAKISNADDMEIDKPAKQPKREKRRDDAGSKKTPQTLPNAPKKEKRKKPYVYSEATPTPQAQPTPTALGLLPQKEQPSNQPMYLPGALGFLPPKPTLPKKPQPSIFINRKRPAPR